MRATPPAKGCGAIRACARSAPRCRSTASACSGAASRRSSINKHSATRSYVMSDTMTDTKAETCSDTRATPSDFFWYELMTPDQAASEAFYTKVVGWTAAAQHADGHGN